MLILSSGLSYISDAQISPDLASILSVLNYGFPDLRVLHWSLYVVGEVSGMSVMFCGI